MSKNISTLYKQNHRSCKNYESDDGSNVVQTRSNCYFEFTELFVCWIFLLFIYLFIIIIIIIIVIWNILSYFYT